jgi:hypothetical protein
VKAAGCRYGQGNTPPSYLAGVEARLVLTLVVVPTTDLSPKRPRVGRVSRPGLQPGRGRTGLSRHRVPRII